jgi:hypothetical protein
MITWDILFPTIPHRHAGMCAVLEEIGRQWQPGLGVILYRDNLRRRGDASYAKWQELEEMSQADYTSFIADDDWIAPDFVARVMEALEQKPDYVGYAVRVTRDGARLARCEHSLRHPGPWSDTPGLLKRDIVHHNPIRRDLALLATWPTDHQAADRTWAGQLRGTGRVLSEVWIPEEMYYYQETAASWTRVTSGGLPAAMPEGEIEPLPSYPWLTVVDECAAP